ncbi:TMV resistance protein N-like [Pyrus ussuriensis x Pyrus communis]|uniref:TMV resistance protein N-like n=1 Tax=Pyrus ussuriensis x Pyrus communis TaxID=2448454 RepID=A0A5N5H4X0_9ROSA|nr:TMV resistance protein N-like [Pyrus ussuriensis x Pyrus communis]
MGGIGKTTLAETVFHRLSSKFEASCFLKNAREKSEQLDGLDCLQKKLLSEIFKEEGLYIGSTIVRNRLSHIKVLIVLDVSSPMQMERLAGDRLRYGTGSRIIITSRDRGTLRQTVEEDNIHEELAKKTVDYAKGVPLALTVLGPLFFNCKSKEDWEDEFNKLKQFPSEDIQKVLRISYDRLGKYEKEIFLDIACFHKGKKVNEETPNVEAILLSSWYESEKQPLNFKLTSNLIMLIGITFRILDRKSAASLDLPDSLRYLDWFAYPLESLPSKFSPENLVELHMPYSQVKKLWKEDKRLVNLQVLDLSRCERLVEIPWYFQDLDRVTHFHLRGCTSLKYLPEMPGNIKYLDLCMSGIKELPQSVWSHEKISYLNISCCRNLQKLPSHGCKLKVSGSFNLDGCTSLREFSELPRDISKLSLIGFQRLIMESTDDEGVLLLAPETRDGQTGPGPRGRGGSMRFGAGMGLVQKL